MNHMRDAFLIRLNQLDSSYLILLLVIGIALAAVILFYSGLLGWFMGLIGKVLGGSIRKGFQLWELLFAWASWPLFLAIVLGWLVLGWSVAGFLPVCDGRLRPGSPFHGVDGLPGLHVH